ncbi:restriction endonuclease subunit S [Vibrio litoralis]|uniref:restriction endonuclease subunit S n=1 Tax=Vibrio litoralis TaxID=335972 RepID=UPI0004181FB6|nr:restriction endonuclease subunit S [Vibrio litoralis]
MSNVVPEGWAIETIGDIAFVKGGKRLPKGETFSENKTEYPYIRVTDFKNGGIDQRDLRFVDESIRNKIKRYVISSNDLYISIAGTLGLVGEVPNNLDGALLTENAAKIVFKQQCQSNKSYFKYYLNSDEPQHSFNQAKGTGGGVPKLALFRIEETQTLLPPLPEQKKIAAILTSVDEVIEKTQAQIDKLKDLKTAMMQELLTCGVGVDGKPHTEFKDSPVGRIPKGWEVVELDTLLNVMESGWSPQCETEKADSGDWCILKTTAVSWDGFNYLANKKLPASLEPRPEIQVKSNNILITRAGPADRVGVVSYVESVPEKVMLSDKIIRLTTKETIHESFLSFWLAGTFAQRFMANRISGLASSQTNISQAILKSIPCVVPSLTEQEIIVNSITSVNNHLRVSIERLSSQQILKKALMQDLLTGKVRVKVD